MKIHLDCIYQGSFTDIYGVRTGEENRTLFGAFIQKNLNLLPLEIDNLRNTLLVLSDELSPCDDLFEFISPDHRVCELYYCPDKIIRVICLKLGGILILGNCIEIIDHTSISLLNEFIERETFLMIRIYNAIVKSASGSMDEGEIKRAIESNSFLTLIEEPHDITLKRNLNFTHYEKRSQQPD